MIEARQGDSGFVWHYARARMNSVALRVMRNKHEVLSVPTISWEQTFDPREPYTLFTFKPGQEESLDHLSPVRRKREKGTLHSCSAQDLRMFMSWLTSISGDLDGMNGKASGETAETP